MSALRIQNPITELGTSSPNWPQSSQTAGDWTWARDTYNYRISETVKTQSKNKTSQSLSFLTALNRVTIRAAVVVAKRTITTDNNPNKISWICLWATQGHLPYQLIWRVWWTRSSSSRIIVGIAIAAYVTVVLCSLLVLVPDLWYPLFNKRKPSELVAKLITLQAVQGTIALSIEPSIWARTEKSLDITWCITKCTTCWMIKVRRRSDRLMEVEI